MESDLFHYDITTYGDRYASAYDKWWPEVANEDPQIAVLERYSEGSALELGVGSGRVAVPLARRGVEVHGLDASQEMLNTLRAKPGGEAVVCWLGDFAEIDVEHSYSLIYCIKNTFLMLTTQEEQIRCFRSVAARLSRGGRFLLETFVPEPDRFDRGQRVNVKLMHDDAVLLQASLHDPLAQTVTSHDVVLGRDGVELYPLKTRYVWPSELDLMARLADLRLSERWSDWSGRAPSADSRNLISIYAHDV
jgi:SAM-dependent methyltransferase